MTDDFKVDLKSLQAAVTCSDFWIEILHRHGEFGVSLAQAEMAKEKQTYEELMAGKKEEIKVCSVLHVERSRKKVEKCAMAEYVAHLMVLACVESAGR